MTWLANLLGFGRAKLIDDSGELQRIQVVEGAVGSGFADRITDNVVRLTEFGFTSSPPADAEVMVMRRGGERAQSVVIATGHRPSRPRDLKSGDAGIYDIRGASVMLTEDGLVIDCAGLPAIIRNVGSGAIIEGTLTVTENLAVSSGATGIFSTGAGDTVTVQDGIITNIY